MAPRWAVSNRKARSVKRHCGPSWLRGAGRSVRDALPGRGGGALLHAAQVVEGGDQLLVLCRIRRHVGRRAALLVLVVLEVAAQPGLALGLVLALELVRDLLQDLDVRLDALGLDRAAGRGVVARRRQPDGAVAAERDDGLDGALAEGAGAEHRAALVVLEGAGDDLGRRGRATVDQHHERLALGQVAGLGVVAL